MMRRVYLWLAIPLILSGCVSVDEDALAARTALTAGQCEIPIQWSEDLANDSIYSKNLGLVEAGRVQMLCGNFVQAEGWFRRAIDSAVDRKENSPKIKLGDVANTALASTVTDDRTREYYLPPYEINLALGYGIIAQALNGKRNDALADARLAVYLQENLSEQYGADLKTSQSGCNRSAQMVYKKQSASLTDVMAGTRNSWENPVLWWLTGVLFEADNDMQMAWQSYRKAWSVRGDCEVFANAVARADANRRTPADGKAKLVVVYEDGLVPMRHSLKVPVPLYTMMSIDIPQYKNATAYMPGKVEIMVGGSSSAAAPALDVRALAARDLDEQLPGIIMRNITRAAVQAGAQAAANASGNDYVKIGVLIANAVVTAVRRADVRSWVTLPDGQQVWENGELPPGNYQVVVKADGREMNVPVTLAVGETKLLWIADAKKCFRTGIATL